MKIEKYIKKRIEFIDKRIDYFETLKQHKNTYLNTININYNQLNSPSISDDEFSYKFNSYKMKKLEYKNEIDILKCKIDMYETFLHELESEKRMLTIMLLCF